MAAFAVAGFLIGALLARRHVLVLLPAFIAGTVAIVALAATTAMNLSQIAIDCGVLALGLQLGYAAALVGELLLAGGWAPRLRGSNAPVVRGRS